MQVSDIFRFKNREIKALHLTWIAFFICFYVWFNMAPLASSSISSRSGAGNGLRGESRQAAFAIGCPSSTSAISGCLSQNSQTSA